MDECRSCGAGVHPAANRRTYKTAFIVVAFFIPTLSAQPPKQPASANPATPSREVEPIPLAQIVLKGEELSLMLRDASRRLPEASELAAFDEDLRLQEESVGEHLKESAKALAGSASIAEIKEQARQLRAYNVPEARQRKTLKAWGAACEQSIAVLKKELGVWQATLKSARDVKELESVVPRVRQAITDIQEVKGVAEERLRTVVDLQSLVSGRTLAIADMVEKLGDASQRFQRRLLHADADPIWRVPALPKSGESLGSRINRCLALAYSSLAAFVEARQGLIGGMILFLTFAFAGIRWFSRATLETASSDPSTALASRILRRPVSLAVLMTSPVILISFPLARMSAVLLLVQLFVLPITRILPLLAGSWTRLVYFFSAFYALNGLVDILSSDSLLGRQLGASLVLAALLILVWWERADRIRVARTPSVNTRKELLVIRWSFLVLAPILITNVFGFLLLSNLLRLTALVCPFIGLAMYTLVRTVSTLLTVLFRSPRLNSLATVRLHEDRLVKWTGRALGFGALLFWVYVTLDLLTLKPAVFSAFQAALNARLGFKTFSISLGDVLGFVCVLSAGYLIVSAIRFILREEILSRFRLSRGVPEMISNSLYYVLLLLVFLISLTAAGVQLDRLTVLTGALGVGVGFGLQGLVNNFVSGLVLQFERPIRIGDILEVGTVTGTVCRIGIRSSTVRTFQGAEVVIPNSALVSDQVTNWTLSEPRRRVEVAVRVAYGTEPERVIGLLTKVACDHPKVLRQPAPDAVFQGFGLSALEFLLLFWAEQNTHFHVRSEVSIAVNAALRQAGIEVPVVPPQDIRALALESPSARRAAGSGQP